MRLDGKIALITGGASGIGLGIAERFAEAGAAVTIFDIDGAGASRITGRLCATTRALAVQGDVSREEDVRACVARAAAEFGAIDILVNNAGIEIIGPVDQLGADQWDRQIAVNLRGAFLCSKYVVPYLRGRGGAILHIASVHALVSWAGCAAYDASKAALLGLTRAMALDHGKDGIRVNAICPGYIDTPLMDQWLASQPDRGAALQRVFELHPLGRIGTPRDIAEAALFLVSGAASFISGVALVVDGAMSAAGH